MESQISNNKKIAKNTMYLYIRTLIVLGISLYTSRVVLQVLGAEDLGIYNVVGGIVSLMSFFQAAQTKATSRFLTYELGKKSDQATLRNVFSVCMTIHILIAFICVILGETIGLWIITNWTEIPIERQNAAMWVYQFALIAFCIQIVRVPYDSVVVAHERMGMYAYMSIIEVILQLGIVLLLMVTTGDSLIYYSVSVAFIAFVLCLCYYIYVRTNFKEYHYEPIWDKKYSISVLSFSGWTLLGAGANTATQQGVSLLMNNFVGLVANAALGFAGQVNIAVSKFVNGFSTAFTPQIIKLYAQNNNQALNSLINRASKFSFALCYIMALPLIINMDFVLHLWLGNNVPQYTLEFCQLILVCTIFDATTGVYNTTVTATGNIKAYQVCITISFLLDLLFSSILLLLNVHPAIVFGSRIITRGFINMFIGLYFLNNYIGFSINSYFANVLRGIIVTLFATVIPVLIISHFTEGWIRVFSTSIMSTLIIAICVVYVVMTKNERSVILNKIKAKIHG